MGTKSVNNISLNRDDIIPPAECIIDVLGLRLNCNNSTFNNQHYLQLDGTAQGSRMSCLYSDIARYSCNLKALSYVPAENAGNVFVMTCLFSGSIPEMI